MPLATVPTENVLLKTILAIQISGYGTLALDLPQLKPGRPVSTHAVYWHQVKIHAAVCC